MSWPISELRQPLVLVLTRFLHRLFPHVNLEFHRSDMLAAAVSQEPPTSINMFAEPYICSPPFSARR
jgi:hypothetical protein